MRYSAIQLAHLVFSKLYVIQICYVHIKLYKVSLMVVIFCLEIVLLFCSVTHTYTTSMDALFIHDGRSSFHWSALLLPLQGLPEIWYSPVGLVYVS